MVERSPKGGFVSLNAKVIVDGRSPTAALNETECEVLLRA